MAFKGLRIGMIGAATGLILAFALGRVAGESPKVAGESCDLVIVNGRVMDPESGLDAVRNVGIRGGKLVAISESPLTARATIDAKGLVVAPGFIDLHEHGQDPAQLPVPGARRRDDVAGTRGRHRRRVGLVRRARREVADQFRRERRTHTRAHESDARSRGFLPTGDAAHRAATAEELAEMSAAMEKGFREGALAEGMGVNYTAAATHTEIVEMFRVAAKYGASVHVHLRYAGVKEPYDGTRGTRRGGRRRRSDRAHRCMWCTSPAWD